MSIQKGLEVNQDNTYGNDENKEELKENEIELKIDSVAQKPNEYGGSLSRGVKVGNTWYNVRGDTEEIINKSFGDELLAKGNTVIVEVNATNTITNFVKLVKKSEKSNDDMLDLDTLLADAHEKGLVAIKTQAIQIDVEKKIAIFKATISMQVKSKDGKELCIKEFNGYGDALPDMNYVYKGKDGKPRTAHNMESETIRPHFIRMAETRAIARGLRWATNNAKTCKEEL